MMRFMRSARIGSKSARWQTTSNVLHLPAIGRASNCSGRMPLTAARSAFGPLKYDSISGENADMIGLRDEQMIGTRRSIRTGACVILPCGRGAPGGGQFLDAVALLGHRDRSWRSPPGALVRPATLADA